MASRMSTRNSPASSDNVLGTDNGPQGLMRAALGFTEVSVSIPENATLAEVEKSLQLAITGYRRLSEASERLKPIIGRILLTIQARNLFKPDYKNFTAFLMDRVVAGMGLGRSHAFDSLRIARAFPNMTTEEYSRYGASRLLLAAKLTDETKAGYKDVLKDLAKQTVEEGRARVKELTPHGSASSYTISIRVTPEVKGEWVALMESVDLTPGELFAQMMESVKTSIKGYTNKKPISDGRDGRVSRPPRAVRQHQHAQAS